MDNGPQERGLRNIGNATFFTNGALLQQGLKPIGRHEYQPRLDRIAGVAKVNLLAVDQDRPAIEASHTG